MDILAATDTKPRGSGTVSLKGIMDDTREGHNNEGCRTIAGYKGTRDRLHECDDESTRML